MKKLRIIAQLTAMIFCLTGSAYFIGRNDGREIGRTEMRGALTKRMDIDLKINSGLCYLEKNYNNFESCITGGVPFAWDIEKIKSKTNQEIINDYYNIIQNPKKEKDYDFGDMFKDFSDEEIEI